MRIVLLMFVALLSGCIAGCAAPGRVDPNHAATIQFVTAQREAEQLRIAGIAASAANCTDDGCRTTIAAIAALAGMQGGQPQIPTYRKQFHPAWNILGATLPTMVSAAVSWHQSDNSRDIALGQFDFLGGVVASVANSPALHPPAAPSITVGGDYVSGQQHIGDDISGQVGDAIGRDAIGGDQHVGDAIGRDVIGGDRIDNSGNLGNDNRIESPGPYDNDTDNGNRCTGDQCQGEGGDATVPDTDG